MQFIEGEITKKGRGNSVLASYCGFGIKVCRSGCSIDWPKTRPFGRITQFRFDVATMRIANRSAAFAATALFAFIPWGPKLMPQGPAAKIETPPPAPVAAVQTLPESALINVNARPWGYVTIPGYVQKKETPVRSLKIKTGPQMVKVYYEPENQWVTAKVDAKSGGVTNCFASFGQNPTLTCK